jgi:DNA-binding GntR family transcriptional regulator
MSHQPETTLSERIFQDLCRRITIGDLLPNARLGQAEIAAQYHASHVPVREAFGRLEAEGLVRTLPRRGVRVTVFDAAAQFEIIEMRAVLEPLALRHAAAASQNIPAWIDLLDVADQACTQAQSSVEWEAANAGFHLALTRYCPLPRLVQQVDRLRLQALQVARQAGPGRNGFQPREDRDHRSIIAALRNRDVDEAAFVLAKHLRRAHPVRQN